MMGAFEANTLTTQRASALRITTIDEGILFFTKSSRGNNVHADYNPSKILLLTSTPILHQLPVQTMGHIACLFASMI